MAWVGPRVGKLVQTWLERLRTNLDVFEVKDYKASLEVLDARGSSAIYTRRERVRFLRDHVTAFYDHGWGTGATFASHRIRPGRIAERLQIGQRFRSLVVLPAPKNRGDEFTFTVRRSIRRGGFGGRTNWLEMEMYHKTQRAKFSVTLPRSRAIVSARVVDALRQTTSPITVRVLRDGRQQAQWSVRQPQVGARFTLEWTW